MGRREGTIMEDSTIPSCALQTALHANEPDHRLNEEVFSVGLVIALGRRHDT